MKQKLLYLLPLFLLSGCGQATYKNASLPAEERAGLLLKELTLEEKVSLMMDSSKPVERLGIKPYNWWNEALHGVARAGLATVFPQPIGMAASFSPETVYEVFTAVSDEARAKNAYYTSQESHERYQGLTMWTPTVNIYRDPRWGRGIETYGEDPYLTSRMGVMVVKGLQGTNDGKYDKLHACAKHFAVHSGPEWNRHEFNAENIKPRDLYETYLPPFEALVKEGKVKEVMCAYNRFEGDPCCGSDRLLMQILRDEWGFDGIVLSDCGAIADFYRDYGHKTHPDAESASAAAVLSGTDLECGSSYEALVEAVKQGKIDEKAVDVAVKRLLTARFALGEMDEPEKVSWTGIPFSVVASAGHDSLALDMARKSMTLLMNKDNTLPLICFFMLPSALLSNALVLDEAVIVSYMMNIAYVWTGILIVASSMTVHSYSFGKNVLVCLLTIVGMGIILFLAMLFLSVSNRMISFIGGLISEISIRL